MSNDQPLQTSPYTEPQADSPNTADSARPRLRWKLGLAILLTGIAGTVLMARFAPDDTSRMIRIFKATGTTIGAMLVWWLGFSGLTWKTRRNIAAVGTIAIGLLLVGTIRRVTFDGDMKPRLQFRWSPPAANTIAQEWLAKNAPPVAANAAGQPAAAEASSDSSSASDASAVPASEPLDITDADWPTYCGKDGNREILEPQCSFDWVANPPKELWRHPVGDAWSSFTAVGSLLLTQEQRANLECVVCYDALSGKELWRREDEARYESAQGAIGPRATPTVTSTAVFALGATGILNALDPRTGKQLWQRNVCTDADSDVLEWGMSGSPLIYEKTVIIDAGGDKGKAVIAYDRETGEIVWASASHKAGYTTPRLETIGGVLQLLVFHGDGLDGMNPQTGEVLWQYPSTNQYKINVAQPMRFGDQIFISSGYDSGCVLLNPTVLNGKAPSEVWPKNKNMKLKFNEAVKVGNFIYGLDDGILACLDVQTGERKWKSGRYRYGQILLWGDKLVVQSEPGYVAIVEATPEKFTEVARLEALNDRTWNMPIVNRNRLYVRNAAEAACYELPAAP